MKEPKNFVATYFTGKTGDRLRGTITPDWSEENTQKHLKLVDCPKDAKDVCEIGCGIGRLLREIYDSGAEHCIGVEASMDMIDEGIVYCIDRNIDLIKVDGSGEIDLLKGEGFDFVFSIITFQHIPNTKAVLKYLSEAHRILRDGGELMFQVLTEDYNKGELWTYHSLTELNEHLLDLGFKEITIDTHNRWTIFRAKKNGKD